MMTNNNTINAVKKSLVDICFRVGAKIMRVSAAEGKNLLDIAHENSVPLQGACEGSLACSTCHVILDDKTYKLAADTLTEREEDLLDQAKGLTLTSRLGCQVRLEKCMRGADVTVPEVSVNVGSEITNRPSGRV